MLASFARKRNQRSAIPIARHFSINENAESHLLPRLYVGSSHKLVLSLDEFLKEQKSSTPAVLKEGAMLQLSPSQTNYVTNVMRMVGPGRKKGRWTFQNHDPCVRVFEGDEEWIAQLALLDDTDEVGSQGKKRRRKSADGMTVLANCLVPLRTEQPETSKSKLVPLLCFAPPKKKDRFQWILEKSTELGMAGWLLLQTDRTEVFSSRDYWSKGQAYVLEAAEQCERLSIPPFVALAEEADIDSGLDSAATLSKLSSLLNATSREGTKMKVSVLICRERSSKSTPILNALEQIGKGGSASPRFNLILIGPEGGWSPEEEVFFDECQKLEHVWNVSLGRNVLRTDTAVVAAMAAFSFKGDR